MIIKTKVRAGAGKLADYLLKSEKNERAELLDMRGFSVDNLKAALGIEEELAQSKTRCEKPFYHVAFRAAPGEELTPEQWQHCAARFEEKLGLENHHRALVMHTTRDGDKLQQHMHVVYSRLDPETLKAANLFRDHYHCKEVARELEREFGLQPVRDQAPERELEPPTLGEDQQARRKGQDLEQARAAIREAWERSDDGKSFAAALEERGFVLAQGERRDFVAVDEEGSVYSIGKRTTGARAAEVREKLGDLDRADLPTAQQAREQQREREPEREQQREREEQRERELKYEERLEEERRWEWTWEPEKALARAAVREVWEYSDDGKSFAKALEERGFTLAQGEDRDYVAVDERGSVYGFDQRTTGERAADVREKLAYLADEYVPTVEEVRWQQHEREPERTAAPALDLEPGKGAARALGGVVDAGLKAVEGVLDFFVGAPPKPKEPERIKTIDELVAESRAARQAELDRLNAMTEEERKQERERRRERERERERGRER